MRARSVRLVQVALGQAIAARSRTARAGGDPPPPVAGDANPSVRPERNAARLQQPERRDHPLEGPGDALARAAEPAVGVQRHAGADQEGRLPSGATGALAASGLGGHVDGVGADDGRPAELDPGGGHLEAYERHDRLDLALLGLGALLDLSERGGEAVVVDLEAGGPVPEAGQEVGGGEVGALGRVRRRGDPRLLEVGAGDLGPRHRRRRLAEALEAAELGRVVAYEPRRQRPVLREAGALDRLADLVGDLLPRLDEVAEDLGSVAGQVGQGVSEMKVAHARALRPRRDPSSSARSLAGYRSRPDRRLGRAVARPGRSRARRATRRSSQRRP